MYTFIFIILLVFVLGTIFKKFYSKIIKQNMYCYFIFNFNAILFSFYTYSNYLYNRQLLHTFLLYQLYAVKLITKEY